MNNSNQTIHQQSQTMTSNESDCEQQINQHSKHKINLPNDHVHTNNWEITSIGDIPYQRHISNLVTISINHFKLELVHHQRYMSVSLMHLLSHPRSHISQFVNILELYLRQWPISIGVNCSNEIDYQLDFSFRICFVFEQWVHWFCYYDYNYNPVLWFGFRIQIFTVVCCIYV